MAAAGRPKPPAGGRIVAAEKPAIVVGFAVTGQDIVRLLRYLG